MTAVAQFSTSRLQRRARQRLRQCRAPCHVLFAADDQYRKDEHWHSAASVLASPGRTPMGFDMLFSNIDTPSSGPRIAQPSAPAAPPIADRQPHATQAARNQDQQENPKIPASARICVAANALLNEFARSFAITAPTPPAAPITPSVTPRYRRPADVLARIVLLDVLGNHPDDPRQGYRHTEPRAGGHVFVGQQEHGRHRGDGWSQGHQQRAESLPSRRRRAPGRRRRIRSRLTAAATSTRAAGRRSARTSDADRRSRSARAQ